MSFVGSLIAISLLLLAALGITGAVLMGRGRRRAEGRDPDADKD